jgi:PAS domain S-box-containing protein
MDRRLEAALQRANELTRQILLSSHQGIVVHDRQLRYLHWNPFMEHLTGVKEKDVLGKHPLELFPFMVESGLYASLEKALAGETVSLRDLLYTIDQTGQEGWCDNTLTPLRDEKGNIIGVVATVADLSEHKLREDQLRKSETLLAQAEELANLGSWELDTEKQTLNWSAHFFRMLGLEPETGHVPYGRTIEMIHPDDRDRAIRDAEALRTHGHPFDNYLRFVTPSGNVRILHSRAIAVMDETGRVARIRGMSQDVTERKNEEEQLRKSEALLSQAEQMANFGSWEYDFRTRKATLSRHLQKMYEITSIEKWSPDIYQESLHPEDRERAAQIRERGAAECRPWEYVARYFAPKRGLRVHLVRGLPIPGPDGKTERSIGVVQDITEQTKGEGELHRLSQELLRARDDDRRHMARALHESAGQSLVALKMVLGRLQEELPKKEAVAHELLQSANELAREAIREVRTISYLMHPPMLDEAGLTVALRWYAKGFTERSGIEVNVEIPENFGRQSQEIETTVFRVVQEALTNVHRYSGSRTARIRLACEEGQIRAEVQDEGRGSLLSDSAESPSHLGVGIAGMRERVKQLNGVFEIESAPGRGTTVRAILPLAPPETPERISDLDEPAEAEEKPQGQAVRADR